MKKLLFKSVAIGLLATSGLTSAQNLDAGAFVSPTNDPLNHEEIPFHTDGHSTEKGFIPDSVYYLYFSASTGSPISTTAGKAYSSAGCVYMTGVSSLDVNLQLPDGHSIRGFRYFWDDSSAESSSVYIYTTDGAGGFTNVHLIESTGDAGFGSSYENLAGGDLVVDNFTTTYTARFFNSDSGSAQKMCGIRIAMYAPPAAAP